MSKHLLFYDGSCGLCDHIVQFLLKVDLKRQFVFAPLQGKTAAEVLKDLPIVYRGADSLVLVEMFWLRSISTLRSRYGLPFI